MELSVKPGLDVVSKYLSLVQASLGEDSIYIRNKETLEEMFQDGQIDKTLKGELLGELLKHNTSLAQTAMSTSLNWEAKERELALEIEKTKIELDLLLAQEKYEQAKIKASDTNRNLDEANIIRNYGSATYLDGKIVALGDDGKIWEEQEGVKKDNLNKISQGRVLESQNKDVQAKTHEVIAKTYTNFGIFNGYTISQDGIIDVSKISTNVTLSDTQQAVARETAKGYVWNVYANSATAMASMIGVQISSGNVTGLTEADVNRFRDVIDKMNAVVPTSI